MKLINIRVIEVVNRCKILDVLVLNRADGLNYYINKKQNIPNCRNNYKIKYQNHGKMKSEAFST
jgi:hypothetical protein